MSKIKLSLDYAPVSGKQISFFAPCASDTAEGLVINDVEYALVDANGVSVTGINNLWNTGAMVSVIIDTGSLRAYLQNADTNAYLEGQLANKAPAYTYGTEDLTAGTSELETGKLYFVYE